MHEIKIPKTIKIGGFDYKIEMTEEARADLDSRNRHGEHASVLRRIRIRPNDLPQQTSQTFLHEVVHAIDDIYLDYSLEEKEVGQLANGLLQVFEQLGVRFTK
jgi:hypothetical protein